MKMKNQRKKNWMLILKWDDSGEESKDELDELKESANVFKHLSLKKKDK